MKVRDGVERMKDKFQKEKFMKEVIDRVARMRGILQKQRYLTKKIIKWGVINYSIDTDRNILRKTPKKKRSKEQTQKT